MSPKDTSMPNGQTPIAAGGKWRYRFEVLRSNGLLDVGYLIDGERRIEAARAYTKNLRGGVALNLASWEKAKRYVKAVLFQNATSGVEALLTVEEVERVVARREAIDFGLGRAVIFDPRDLGVEYDGLEESPF